MTLVSNSLSDRRPGTGARTLHGLFEAQAARRPDHPAIECGDVVLSYGEVDRKANRLAHRLVAAGIGPDAPVGVCLRRGPDLFIVLLAVLKAGGAYVPLEPGHPLQRLTAMIAEAGIQLVVSDESAPAGLAVAAKSLSLDSAEDEAATPPDVELSLDNTAYVLFTSGTTGQPKGVAVSHRGVENLGAVHAAALAIDEDSRVLQFAAPGFDVSIADVVQTWYVGATLIMPARPAEVVGEGMADLLARAEITHAMIPPSVLATVPPVELPRLRALGTGGEPCPPELIARWARDRRMFNMYGPTEATVTVTLNGPLDADATVAPSLGGAVENFQVVALDAQLRPVSDGATGELYISGPGLARGYVSQPGLTAARFVADPAGSTGSRMYRTGDLVRRSPGDVYEYVGRTDHQIKVQGQRVETGEIETALAAHDQVVQAVVTLAEIAGRERLVAYYVPVDEPPDHSDLRAYLRTRLPRHMVPATLVALDRFPLSTNGKVDRAALPAPTSARAAKSSEPRTELEAVLAEIWSTVLGFDRVGVDDDFFVLGGDSISGLRMAFEVERRLGRRPASGAVFDYPTIAGYAVYVSGLAHTQEELAPIEPVDRSTPLPASSAQRRLWFLHSLEPYGAAYNCATGFHIEGELDVDALSVALTTIVARHESLRTTFAEHDGQVMQILAPVTPIRPRIVDLSERLADVEAELAAETSTPFDLSTGPVLRALLVRTAPREHVFVLTTHHIAADAWSMDVIGREIGVLYDLARETVSQGVIEASGLPKPFPQYADAAAWQESRFVGAHAREHLEYWKRRLADVAPVELPTDRRRPAIRTSVGDRHLFTVAAETVERLTELGHGLGTTLYTPLAAATQLLLARWSGQDDIVLGTVDAGRSRAELADVVGFFASTIVLRSRIDESRTFAELVTDCRETVREAVAHDRAPFDRVVDAVLPERDLSRTPLVSTMLVLQNTPADPLSLSGLEVHKVELPRHAALFDVTLEFWPDAAGLIGSVEYSADLFDTATMRRFAEEFGILLDALAQAPDRPMAEAAMVSGEDIHELLLARNDTARGIAPATLPELFKAQASATPHAVAVVCGDIRLTYAELDARANQLAQYLNARGVRSGDRVGLCVERGAGLIVALLGILKAGAAYVPIDPAYPAQRREFMVRDAGLTTMVTVSRLAQVYDTVDLVLLDQNGDDIAAADTATIRLDITPDSEAYLSYTSGSTGLPKATMTPHRAVHRVVCDTGYIELTENDVVAQFASVSFDAATFEIWGALLNGGTLAIAPPGPLDTPMLGEFLTEHRVTTLWLTAGMFHEVVDADLSVLSGLKYLLAGGDALSAKHCHAVLAGLPGVTLINGYGPTETTTFAAACRVRSEYLTQDSVPIGTPIADTSMYIVDKWLRLAAPGVAGELYIAGAGLANGYANQPGMTAHRFVADPFGAPGARMYRTGDLVRWRPDGQLEFLGRTDDQVKVRGFRVEPGEVQSILAGHQDVAQALVLVRGRKLCAYVVPRDGASVDAGSLREFLASAVPDYMVPAGFLVLGAFPLTPNGKVDRSALPDIDVRVAGYQAPATQTERTLAGIWAGVLGLEQVGADDNFFDLGGDSILSIQVVSRARKAGILLSSEDVFVGQTVRALAQSVDQGESAQSVRATAAPAAPTLPLGPMQAGMLFHALVVPGAYLEQLMFVADGVTDLALLAKSWQHAVDEIEALRIGVVWQDVPEPVQVVHPNVALPLRTADWRGLPEQQQQSRWDRLVAEDRAQGLDLDQVPLARLTLVAVADDCVRVLFTFHHLLLDGWSLGRVLASVHEDYAARRDGREIPVITGGRGLAAQAEWLRSRDVPAAEEFWRSELAAAVPVIVPGDRVLAGHGTTRSSGRVTAKLPAGLSAQLTQFARRNRLTVNAVVQGLWALMLWTRSGQDDILFGATGSGRSADLPGAEEMIGVFINTMPVRVRMDGQARVVDWLAQLQAGQVRARRYDYLPLTRVQALSGLPADQPMFETIVVFENYPLDLGTAAGLGPRLTEIAAVEDTNYPLNLLVYGGEEFQLTVAYAPDVYDQSTAQSVLDQLVLHAGTVAAVTDETLADLEMVNAAQRGRLLDEWGSVARDIPPKTIPRLFQDQLARTPEIRAVVDGDVELTYAQLHARASKLAHHIIALGVRPGDRVGVAFERSADWVIAMQAVFHAGAVYVPLDPEYPADRLAYMIDDCRAVLILTKAAHQESLAVAGCPVVTVDTLPLEEYSSELPDITVDLRQIGYVIYTSGSTGRPKGVEVPHQGFAALRTVHTEQMGVRPGDRVLQSTSPSFDASIFEVLSALTTGGTLILTPPGTYSAEQLVDLLHRHEVTHAVILPAMLGTLPQAELPHLRTLLVGAEPVPRGLVTRWADGRRMMNGYGPTENSIAASFSDPLSHEALTDPPIGRPFPGIRLYVLDRFLRLVPPGVAGELYIAGGGVAQGYVNRPGQTAERFVADPFGGPGTRMYRSGDVARWDADGQLRFAGRVDAQVKLRGHRVELGEIEAALITHPAVGQAAVVLREGKRLVGFVSPAAGYDASSLNSRQLQEFLAKALPDYMVPAGVLVLDALPLTPNGKVDRGSLPDNDIREPAADYVAPGTPVQEALAAIWAEVLGVDRIGAEDNFFDLGGDSILSIQVVSRAKSAGIAITPADIFDRQTIAAIAADLDSRAVSTARDEYPPVTGPVVLTPIQRWFLKTHREAPHHFNMAMRLATESDVDQEALAGAVRAIVRHHDALRMRYERKGTGWRQRNLAEDTAVCVERHDLSGIDAERQDAALREIGERAQSGFDLTGGPLIRVVLLHLGPADTQLLLVIHHLVVDGVSWRVLLDDLSLAYQQIRTGKPVDLGPKSTSFQDWAARLREHVESGGFDEELPYWSAVGANLPTKLPVEGEAEYPERLAIASAELSTEDTRTLLRTAPAVYRTRVHEVLLAVLGRVVGEWTGWDQVVVNVEGHGREEILDDVDLARTVGWFTTIFPLVIDGGKAGWDVAVKSAKERVRAVPNRGIGHGALAHLGDPDSPAGALGRSVRPEISFNYLGQFDGVTADSGLFRSLLPGLSGEHSGLDRKAHRLDVVGRVADGKLLVEWGWPAGAFSETTMAALATRFIVALKDFLAHCAGTAAGGYSPSDFPLVQLDQAAVDRVTANRDVADVLPLGPMQAGMLFHALVGTGSYFEQLTFVAEGVHDAELFGKSWQRLTDEVEALRVGVAWQGLPEPVQVVYGGVTLPIETLDWRDVSTGEQQSRWDELVAADQRRGLSLDEVPLARLTLVAVSDDRVRVLFTFHHILLDGWSVARVLSLVFSDYAARSAGAALPEIADGRGLAAQARWLRGQDVPAAEEFWTSLLDGFDSPVKVVGDRTAIRSDQARSSARLGVRLTPEQSQRVTEFARRHRLTVNAVVQGLWALLLWSRGGQDDIVFGATSSGRSADMPGVEAMLGVFINTMPVRVRVDPSASVVDWLTGLQAEQVRARRFDYLPLTRVQALSGLPADRPLFDTIVVFANYPVDTDDAVSTGLRIHDVKAFEATNYSLNLAAYIGDTLEFQFLYDPAVFDRSTIEGMRDQLVLHAEAVASATTEKLSDLDTIDAATREEILGNWGRGAYAGSGVTLTALVAQQVAARPDAPALVVGGQQTTYRELDVLANRLAHRLIESGVQPDARVGLCLGRNTDFFVSVLAVLKAGAAYVPLDPEYPQERLSLMISDSGTRLVIVDAASAAAVPPTDATLMRIDTEAERAAVAGQPSHAPEVVVLPDNLAHILYTSGSTGRPKGAALPHRGLFRVASDPKLAVTSADVVGQLASVSFDASSLEIWTAWPNGAALAVTPTRAMSTQELGDFLSANNVTAVCITTGLLHETIDSDASVLSGLRLIMTGGEALSPAHAQKLVDCLPHVRLINGYGPTEGTVYSSLFIVNCNYAGSGPVPIGTPIGGTLAYVLDSALRLVPPGVPGELYLSGDGLGRGYVNRPGFTAERFVANPFGMDGSRMYRTGDLVKWLPDGNIDFVSRTDFQVKIRGQRVELGEVEATISDHPAVTQALVTTRDDDQGGKRVVAYVVAAPGTVTQTELKQFADERLPGYMVPAVVVVMDAFPLTPNGKVDRRNLPDPSSVTAGRTGEQVAPRTPAEELHVAIWCEVLGLESVGVEDNFFEIGGDSIRGMQVISRISEMFGVDVPLRVLFDNPTVAGVAEEVGAHVLAVLEQEQGQ